MKFESIHSWLPNQPDGQGASGKRWIHSNPNALNPAQTHRESSHVPVDQADAEKRARAASGEEPKSDFERIIADGFSKFMEDMEAKKIEDLRKALLQAMGITEENLASMPAEQRARIEKLIGEEIRRRMTAAGEISAQEKQGQADLGKKIAEISGPLGTAAASAEAGNGSAVPSYGQMQNPGQTLGRSMGLGPLLALQEVDQKKAMEPPSALGRNDPEKA